MLKYIFAWAVAGSIIWSAAPAVASPMTLTTPDSTHTLNLPSNADHSPVISLGSAIDPQTGELVEGYAIIHYKQGAAKPTGKGGGGSTCYGYMASGAKWKDIEPWVVNPTNTYGISDASIFTTLQANTLKWEDAANGILGDSISTDIMGAGSITSNPLVADETAPDAVNEVYFGNLESGTIGVTIVWGIFGGPVPNRKLSEWDMVFNTDYQWSDAALGEAGKMDFENIATHEQGHSIGLSDLYTSGCTAETMYGYADNGQINKRSLNAGDLAGVNNLY